MRDRSEILKLKKEYSALLLRLCLEDVQDSSDPSKVNILKQQFHNRKRNIRHQIAIEESRGHKNGS